MAPAAVERRTGRGTWLLALIIGGLAAYNVIRSAAIPSGAHFLANVSVAVVALLVARGARMTAPELGLARDRWRDGARWGLGAVAVIGVVVVTAAVVPATSGSFDDDRVTVGIGSMLWRVLIVIPIGTVLVEELVFRGVLHGLLRRRHDIGAAALWGATLFGLWHLFPVWWADDDVGALDPGRWGAVLGTFVATFVAGLVFIWLRHRTGSLLAPILAHIGTNSIPFAVAWFVER